MWTYRETSHRSNSRDPLRELAGDGQRHEPAVRVTGHEYSVLVDARRELDAGEKGPKPIRVLTSRIREPLRNGLAIDPGGDCYKAMRRSVAAETRKRCFSLARLGVAMKIEDDRQWVLLGSSVTGEMLQVGTGVTVGRKAKGLRSRGESTLGAAWRRSAHRLGCRRRGCRSDWRDRHQNRRRQQCKGNGEVGNANSVRRTNSSALAMDKGTQSRERRGGGGGNRTLGSLPWPP